MAISRLSAFRSPAPQPSQPLVAPASTPIAIVETPSANLRPDHTDDLISPCVAAARLCVSPLVLRRWRGTGEGPSYVKFNRKTIRYRFCDLAAFIANRTRTNTASP